MTEEPQNQAFIDSLQQDEVSKQVIASKLQSAVLSSAQASEELAANTASEPHSKKLITADKRSKFCSEVRPCLGPLTVLLLLFINPLGLVVMWMFSPWSNLLKSIITVLSVLLTIFLIDELILFISWL